MSPPNHVEAVQRVARTAQIALGAGAALPLLLLALVVFFDPAGPPPAAGRGSLFGVPFLTLTAVVSGAIGLVLSFVAPGMIVAGMLKRLAEFPPSRTDDADALLSLYQTQLIIASGLTEGTAFFPLLIYAFEPHSWTLRTAAILVAVLLSRFPTADRIHDWLDDQSARLARLRRKPR